MRFKKRILFINGHLNAGGVERSLVDVLRHMDYTTCCNDSAWKTPLRLRNWISTGDLFRFGGVLRSDR